MDRLAPDLLAIREAVQPREEVTAAQLVARTGQRMFDVLANAGELVEQGWLDEVDGGFTLPGRRQG